MEKFSINNENMLTKKIKIPEWEMEFRADRSSGPGGQNVNKTATKITLWFNINESKSLSDDQKRIIKEKLRSSLTKKDEIIIIEQGTRSQKSNREEAIRKLYKKINDALIPEKERIETKISQEKIEKRLTEKKKHSAIKKARSKIDFD